MQTDAATPADAGVAVGPDGSTHRNPQPSIPGLLWAYRFRGDGTATNLGSNVSVDECGSLDGWLWLHFSLTDERAKRFIHDFADLPAQARETLLTTDEHVNVGVTDGVVHGIFVDLERNLSGASNMLGKLHFALDDHLVISTRRSALHSVDAARDRIEAGTKVIAAVGLLEEIVDQFCTAIEGMMRQTADEIDAIEDRVLDNRRYDDRQKLIPVRRLIVKMHRQLLALRGMFHRLESARGVKLPSGLAETANHLAQHLDALDHEAVVLQDRARLLHEEILSKSNAETNANLHVLSILTALLLPPTLIVGIFGMNTKDLPLNQTDGGFWIALLMCFVSSATAYALLRRLNILS
jgi:zinc transporter